jgi:hypothetical protein
MAACRGAVVHPVLRTRADIVRVWFIRALAALSGTALLALAAAELMSAPAEVAAEVAAAKAPVSLWVEVERPHPAFALPMPGSKGVQYAIRRHVRTNGRKDILTWQPDEAKLPRLMIEIYRPAGEIDGFGDLASELRERLIGTDVRFDGASETLDSKFGILRARAFTAGAGPGLQQCLGIRHAVDEPMLLIVGWACSRGPELVDRGAVACALDRLSLLSAGHDPKLAGLFARAELRRTFCGQRSPILYATPKRADWIETGRDPKLRGRLAAR